MWAEIAQGAGTALEQYMKWKQAQDQLDLEQKQADDKSKLNWAQFDLLKRQYDDGSTQRSANTMSTLSNVNSQNQTLRDRLMMLRGGV